MIKNEFKFVGKNRLILISTIVMMLIPILYAAFFLKSVWDPYGKTSELPVAVVNNDKSVKYNGETLDVGDQLVKELKSNHQLKWMFVSEEQAKQGMKDNKYYTTITLPENFSSNAATLLDTNPKKMQITYDTNASRNYIGEVISEAAAKQLNSQIRESVTESYATAIFGQVKTIGKGFKTAATGSKKLSDGTITLNDGLNSYITGVGTVNNGVQTLSTSVVPLKNGVQQLTTGAGSLSAGLSKLDNSTGALASGVSKLDNSTGALASGVSKLDSGSTTLASGVKTYTNGVSSLNTGLNTLSSNSGKLNAGTSALGVGVTKVQAGDQALMSNLKTSANDLDTQLNNSESKDQMKTLMDGFKALDSGVSYLNDQLNGESMPNIDAKRLTADLTQIGVNTQLVGAKAKDAGLQLSALNNNLYNTDNPSSAAVQLKGAQGNMAVLVNFLNSNDFKKLAASNPTLAGSLVKSVTDLGGNLKTSGEDLVASGANASKIKDDLTGMSDPLNDNGTKLKDIQKELAVVQGLLPKLQELKDGVAKLAKDEPKVTAGATKAINTLTGGLTTVKNGLMQQGTGAKNSPMGAIQATELLNDGLNQIQAGLNGTSTAPGLIPSVQQYTAGVSTASAGSKQLAGNNSALVSGSGQLSTGLSTLDGSVPALTSGIGQLSTGSNTLSNGLVTLNNQVPTLVSGVDQLAAGTQKLDDNSAKLGDGSKTLKDGTKTLATALKTGSDTVNGIKATNKTAQMFAAPSELKHKDYSYVPNYGHALAPYVLSLALYVGAIVFNFAFPIRKVSMEGQSATAWFWSKVAIGTVVAIGMAVVEVTGMLMFGLQADHIAQTYLIATTFSLTSMYLVMALAMAFDNPGRFVAMVLLMLQLGGAGGTFPMEVTNSFFNAIHPFLPMTYSTLGFRQSLTSGMVSGQVGISVLILAIFAIVSLVLLWVAMQVLQNIGLAGKSQLDDNQKLQDLEK
ncbi:YhgE/Pip domain-containing protein [Dellaglioa algida]